MSDPTVVHSTALFHVEMPDASGLDPAAGDLSVGVWVKVPAALPTLDGYTILSKGTSANGIPRSGFRLDYAQVDGETTLRFVFYPAASPAWIRLESPAVFDGGGHHLMVVRSGTTFTLYLDGGKVDSGTLSGALRWAIRSSWARWRPERSRPTSPTF